MIYLFNYALTVSTWMFRFLAWVCEGALGNTFVLILRMPPATGTFLATVTWVRGLHV